jgi:TonB family protein
MYIDFEDARPETPTIERAISLREGVLISIFAHLILLGLVIFGPKIPFVRAALERVQAAQLAKQQQIEQQLQLERERQNARFVFVQPRLDTPAPAPPLRPELSDQDRQARALERAPNPSNPLPYSRGNTSERVESAEKSQQSGRGEGPNPEPAPPSRAAESAQQRAADATNGYAFDRGASGPLTRQDGAQASNAAKPPGGSLGEALRNLQKYVQNQNFDNPSGGGGSDLGPLQFDTKGVEFGPWIRRFVAQIRRNWFIPYAAMSMRGHVVLTFYVHKDGRLTDVTVVKPSAIEAFNNAAYNALVSSNPTQPLPPEYPSDRAFFTVTFYYNEQPPQ